MCPDSERDLVLSTLHDSMVAMMHECIPVAIRTIAACLHDGAWWWRAWRLLLSWPEQHNTVRKQGPLGWGGPGGKTAPSPRESKVHFAKRVRTPCPSLPMDAFLAPVVLGSPPRPAHPPQLKKCSSIEEHSRCTSAKGVRQFPTALTPGTSVNHLSLLIFE